MVMGEAVDTGVRLKGVAVTELGRYVIARVPFIESSSCRLENCGGSLEIQAIADVSYASLR